MLTSLVAPHSVTVTRPVFVDDQRGGVEADWSQPPISETVIPGWAVDATGTDEDVTHRDGTRIDLTLRGPYQADVQRGDHITVLGGTFEIVGDVQRQPGVTELTAHTILQLGKWAG